jgi:hypothetical protein
MKVGAACAEIVSNSMPPNKKKRELVVDHRSLIDSWGTKK